MMEFTCIKSHVETVDGAFFRLFQVLHHTDMNSTYSTFVFFCVMAVVWLCCGKCESAPELADNIFRKFRSRPVLRRYTVENPFGEAFDDYGHMRFGKREQYDDYGHMRYGRHHE